MSQPDQQGPAAAKPAAPASSAPAAAPSKPEDPRDRAARLEAELLEARAEAAGLDTVQMKVEPPHESFTHANVTVRSDFTPVPARTVPALMTAAEDAGVTLTQEG